jgi:(S)-mandelate dehydrogenase
MRLNVEDFRRDARRKLPRFVFEYLDGGSGDEGCLRRNSADFSEINLVPSCLRDTSKVDLSVEVFGKRWQAPIGIAPIGFAGLMRPKGDELLARAAAAQGIPFIQSTASNSRLERVREAAPDGEKWLQLYVLGDRSIAEQIVRRAKREAYSALVLTVDVPVAGYRERELRNGFKIPFRPSVPTVIDLLKHPGWMWGLARHGVPQFVNLSESTDTKGSAQVQATLLAKAMDRALAWESLEWIRKIWQGPLLLKGVLSGFDAEKAVGQGVDGIIVSNHGGRQLDSAPSTIAALPEVVDRVGKQVPVFLDSGIRRGSDIAKALAMGAKAVLIGRPAIYGMVCSGEEGITTVLRYLIDDLTRNMTLLGVTRLSELDAGYIRPAMTSRNWRPANV